MLHIVLYLWQLPQNLLGLLFLAFLHPCVAVREDEHAVIRTSLKMRGGISLGRYVFLSLYQCDRKSIAHELGHCRQSRMLGPLYLVVIRSSFAAVGMAAQQDCPRAVVLPVLHRELGRQARRGGEIIWRNRHN